MRILFLCLLAAACASPVGYNDVRNEDGARLIAAAPINAPQGLIDYCRRTPLECGGAPLGDLRGREEATGAADVRAAQRMPQASLFQTMMAAHRAGQTYIGAAGRPEMALTAERWAQLARVTRDVNLAIRPSTDRSLYGVDEFWARPTLTQGASARGDCEDYALEKRARLIALGWSSDTLALATAMAPGVGLHAVLIAQTDHGDFVLDNLSAGPAPLAEVNYFWLTRQSGPALTQWASVELDGAMQAAMAAPESPEARFARMMRARTHTNETAPETTVEATLVLAPMQAPLAPMVSQSDGALLPVRGLRAKGEYKPSQVHAAKGPEALVRSALT